MNEDIKHIKDELRMWERDGCNTSFLDELSKEPTKALTYKYRKIKELERYIKRFRNNPTYVEPFTILLYKEAVRHEIRKRKWSWSIVKFSFPFSRWYMKTFRGKDLIDDRKYFGPRTERNVLLKTSQLHTNVSVFVKPPLSFLKKNWQTLLPIFVAIIAILVTIYIYTHPNPK